LGGWAVNPSKRFKADTVGREFGLIRSDETEAGGIGPNQLTQ
jgi:hypothetical protein